MSRATTQRKTTLSKLSLDAELASKELEVSKSYQSTDEQVFSKLKHRMRKASARSTDEICEAIRQILPTNTPHQCANYIKNAGYGLT